MGVGRKGGIGVGDDPSASSFTRCLLNKADGRQAGPPSLVIGARAAAKPECFYLRAPGSTSSHRLEYLPSPESRTSALAAFRCTIILPPSAIQWVFRTFGEDDRKITKKAQIPEPAARAQCLRPYKTSEISNRLAGLRANEQYHQMCG